MSDNLIEVRNLNKIFKVPKKSKDLSKFKKRFSWFYREWEEKVAVKDINLDIKKGEILAYLGPNGAGKSTTIKMLTGILHPTFGSIKIFFRKNKNEIVEPINPITDRIEYTQKLGVVFGQRSILTYDIPVKDSFKLYKAIYGLTDEFYNKRLEYLVKMLEIEDFFETPYRMLSLGEKMRCELAASFLHKPEIVFLDEPTIGLDASAKIKIRKFLKKINKDEKVTIMITTHDMDDIEELCERIIFIDKGEKIFDGNLDFFKDKFSNWKRIEVYYKKVNDKEKLKEIKEKYEILKNDGYILELRVPIKEDLGILLKDLVNILDIIDLSITEPKLEEIVANMYDKNKKIKDN
jgi:ABC-2 type transport system ATP-binding protein